jgi:membrane protease YdiL (CAAX protease family)
MPTRAAWWGLAGVGAGLLLSLVLQGLAYLIDPGSEALILLFGEIGLWIALAGACAVASRRYGTGRLSDDFGWRIRPSDIPVGLVAFVGCLVAAGVVGSLFAHTSLRGTNTGIIANQKGNDVGLVVVALLASIGAPVFEELFFRGFLRLAFETSIGSGPAIVAQAACFGLAHFQPNLGWRTVSVVCGTMAIGLVLGYVAHRTGGLGAGMIAHGVFNLAVTLTIVLSPG